MKRLLATLFGLSVSALALAQSSGAPNNGVNELEIIPGTAIVTLKESGSLGAPAAGNSEARGWLANKTRILQNQNARANGLGAPNANANPKATAALSKLNRTFTIDLPSGQSLNEALDALKALPEVENAEPAQLYRTTYVPNDPLYSSQWEHQLTNMEAAWDVERGEADVIVAIVDSGVDYLHEDLQSNMWTNTDGSHGYDFINLNTQSWIDAGYELIEGEDYVGWDNDPMDFNGHGTHCAGIVAAADNEVGIVGVAPGTKIMALRAGFSIRRGTQTYGSLPHSAIINSIIFAADNGADVINMSFGGGGYSESLKNAIDYAYSQGVVLVSSAGNEDYWVEGYPANYPGVISVASLGETGEKAYYSTYGSWVDIAAPGGDMLNGRGILSTVPSVGTLSSSTGYRELQGTSMAGPYVAGAAALLLSHQPQLTQQEVENALIESGDEIVNPSGNKVYGLSSLNVNALINYTQFSTETVAISYPNARQLLNGIVEIEGDTDGAYTLEIGAGKYPSSWQSIASGGTTSGVLGQLDTSSYSDGIYSLRLRGLSGTRDISFVQIDSRLKQGWSQKSILESYSNPLAPTVADLDGDGTKEIITRTLRFDANGKYQAGVYVASADGNDFNNFPVIHPELDDPRSMSPVVGEFDPASPGKEVFVIYSNTGSANDYHLFIYSALGEVLLQRQFATNNTHDKYALAGDFDNDGIDELVVTDGTTQVLSLESDLSIVANTTAVFNTARSIAAADLNQDGVLDIVAAGSSSDYSTYFIQVLNFDGSTQWSQEFTGSLSQYAPILVTDFDLDATLEIAVMAYNGDAELNIIEHDGQAFTANGQAQWPLNLTSGDTRGSSNGLTVSDIDSDGYVDLIYGSSKSGTNAGHYISARNRFGELILDIRIPETEFESNIYSTARYASHWVQPLVADIDSDGELEILTPDRAINREFIALNLDGSLVDGFPLKIDLQSLQGINNPIVDDLENDGILDLVLTGYQPAIFEFGTYDESLVQWSSFQNGEQKQGSLIPEITGWLSNYDNVYFRGTANAWAATPMALVNHYTWEIEVYFDANGRFKFDINGDWSLNFGDNNSDGIVEQGGGDIYITEGAGNYRIRFNDSSMTYTIEKIVTPIAPTANAGADITVEVNSVVQFDASASFDADGTIVSYAWSNGLSGVNPTMLYDTIGIYDVELTVTDDSGLTGTDTVRVTVTEEDTTFESNYPQANVRGTNNSWSTTAMELVADYTWQVTVTFGSAGNERFKFDIYGDWGTNFGDSNNDGYLEQGGGDIFITEGAGDYILTFNDELMTYSVVKVIEPVGPQADAGDDIVVRPGETVTFNGSATSEAAIVSYEWTSDAWEGTLEGQQVSFTFTVVGTYTVTLTVTDENGLSDSDTITVTVENNAPPIARIPEGDITVTLGSTVTFDGSSSYDADGNIASYLWDNGDTTATSTRTFNTLGSFEVTLQVTDNEGLSSAIESVTVTVVEEPEGVDVAFSCANGSTSPGISVYVVGNIPELGNWSVASSSQVLGTANYPTWEATFSAMPANTTIQWKCVKAYEDTLEIIQWQGGGNNTVTTGASGTVSSQGSF